MKRTISTIVLFVLLILTVVALSKLGSTNEASALSEPSAAPARHGAL